MQLVSCRYSTWSGSKHLIGTDCICTFPGTGTEPNSYGYVGRKEADKGGTRQDKIRYTVEVLPGGGNIYRSDFFCLEEGVGGGGIGQTRNDKGENKKWRNKGEKREKEGKKGKKGKGEGRRELTFFAVVAIN